MESKQTKKELEPNEPGSKRGFGCLILDKPLDPDTDEGKAQLFCDQVTELTMEVFGEEKSPVFAAGVMAGMKLVKSELVRFAKDESEPLPEGDHQAAEETNGGDIDKAIAELGLDEDAAGFFRISVEKVENSIASFKPKWQHELLRVVMGRQSQRDAQAEVEDRRENAKDKLFETLDNWSTEKIESLGRLIADEKFVEKLKLVA